MPIEEFDSSPAEWNRFVRSCAGWTHFQLHEWKDLIERIYGHDCIYLANRGPGGEITGVLPLVRVKSLMFGHYLVSMPFLNYGGPLGDARAVTELATHAADLARGDGVKLLELRSRVPLAIDLAVSHHKVTVLLDLPSDPDTLWKALKSKVRSQIRRPQKEGVSVRFGSEEVEPFFSVFAHHMRDLGTPTQSARLFHALAETFPDDVWFGCAYFNGRPVAAGCGFQWGDEFEMTWASALVEYKRVAANMLLYWSFMERAVHRQLRVFNFGRCTPGGNTHRFKLQWGGREDPLWWYRVAKREDVTTPSPDDGMYSMGPRVWRKLPLPIATYLGPRIVRFIP